MALRFTLRQLEYFVAVAEAGSVAGASELVNISSPSISAAIAQLEDEFGIQLFIRQHTKGLSLTPGGRRFLAQAKMLLDHADALHDLASDVAGRARGPISVGCLVTIAPLVFPLLRRGFETEYPEARVSHVEAHQAGLLQKLQRAEIDAAITYDLEIPRDIEFEPLAALPPYVMLAADHPLARRPSVSLAELAREPMVLLDLPMSREYFLSIFHARGLRPLIAERTNSMPVLRSLVANGYGCSLANLRTRSTVAPDGEKLAFVRIEGDLRPMVLGLAMMRSDRRSRILTAFQEYCRERISDAGIPGMAPPI